MGKISAILGVLLACAAGFLVFQQGEIRKLRGENAALAAELRNAEESKAAAQKQPAQPAVKLPAAEFSELMRLRGEVGQLRKLSNELQRVSRDGGKRGPDLANLQPVQPVPENLSPLQVDVQRQNKELERALTMFNAGQMSLHDLLQEKKQRFEFLNGVVVTDPSILKREELVDRQLMLDKTLLQQTQASGTTNSPDVTELETEIRNLEAERRGEPPGAPVPAK